MPFTDILTDRLVLRKLDSGDAGRIFQYHSKPEVARFQSWGTTSREAVASYIAGLSNTKPGAPGSWYQLGIALQSTGDLIGDCGFHVLKAEPRQAELGITLDPKCQLKGFAGETLRALLGYLFVEVGVHRVFASIDPRNIRSIKLMQRVRMRQEAHFVKSLWFKGEWVDDMTFAMLASE